MAMAFDCIQSDAIIQAFKVKSFFGGKAFFKLERLRPSWPSSLGRAWLINFFRENFTLKGLRGLDSLNGLADLWTNGLHRRTKAGPNCFISFLLIAIISFRRNFMPKYDAKRTKKISSHGPWWLVVKWSACLLSTPPILHWIPPSTAIFLYNLCLKRTKINKKSPGLAHFLKKSSLMWDQLVV